jgi:hypothetical protein
MQTLKLAAAIDGTVPPGPPLAALVAWRAAGGTIEVKSLDVAWGPLQLSGAGTLTLDRALQPEGAGTAKIRGYAETVDALVAHRLMRPDDGKLAKAGLTLLAKRPPEGGPRVLTVPLRVQQQMLYAGPIELLRLPTVSWPQ